MFETRGQNRAESAPGGICRESPVTLLGASALSAGGGPGDAPCRKPWPDAGNPGGYRPEWWKYLNDPTIPAQHAGQNSIPADGLQKSGAACAGGLPDPGPADGPRTPGVSGLPGHRAASRHD